MDVLLASKPVKLIVAAELAQTVDNCEAPVNVGVGLTVSCPKLVVGVPVEAHVFVSITS